MKAHKKQAGFTMIELLVGIAIFSIIIAGAIRVFGTNYRSYAAQDDIAAMQQNIRVAKVFLERDVRMAGYGTKNLFVDGEKVLPLSVENNAGANQTDRITLNILSDTTAGCGGNLLPTLTLKDKMPTSSSEAYVNELFDDGNQDLDNPDIDNWYFSFSCNGVTYGRKPPFIEFPVIITSPDRSMSDVIILTNVQKVGGGTIKLQNRPINGAGKIVNTYEAGSTIDFFGADRLNDMTVVYEINANNVLLRNGDPVAENIEDLQFAFCGDFNNDGTVDRTNAADWINNRNLTAAEIDKVRFVRISILGRTAHQHKDLTDMRPAVEDHSAGTSKDEYRRRLLQVTVQVRNLAL